MADSDYVSPPRSPATCSSPIEILLYIILGYYMVLFALSISIQRPIFLVQFVYFGLDHGDFLTASRDVIAGADPYARLRFVTPPLSAILNMPLSRVGDLAAARVFFVVNVASVVCSMLLLTKTCRIAGRDRLFLLFAALFSPSFIMLAERGNIDGVVLLILCAALYLRRFTIVMGLFIGFATLLKIYPIAWVIPSAIFRTGRAAFTICLVVIVSVILFPSMYLQFVHNQVARGAQMHLAENLSFFAAAWYMAKDSVPELWITGAGAVLLAAIGFLCLSYDRALDKYANDDERLFLLTTYSAFFINFPPIVYLYSGIAVFILLAAANLPGLRISFAYRAGAALPLALIMFPAQSFAVTGSMQMPEFLHLIPSIGSGLLLLYVVLIRRNLWQNIAQPRTALA